MILYDIVRHEAAAAARTNLDMTKQIHKIESLVYEHNSGQPVKFVQKQAVTF